MKNISPRYLTSAIVEDLTSRKMVFIGGPRQVGKTTIALSLLEAKSEAHPAYLNWDNPDDRLKISRGELPSNQELIVFDELHKNKKWRGLVKGIYDKNKSTRRFIVTGSARLDYYRFGGDSLQGRYHYYRLHPLSLGELKEPGALPDLLKYGGFPEPLLTASERHWKRWQRERSSRVIAEDLLSLEKVEDVSRLQLLSELLPSRVGAPLSINNLAGDLLASPKSVQRWLLIFDNLYSTFRLSPFGFPRIRAVKKEQKLYLWDWSRIEDPGARFENLVAAQLLKYCHFEEDHDGEAMELRYIRDTDKREVDFVVIKNKHPLFAVECKAGDRAVSPAVRYFAERTSIPKFYQVHLGKDDYEVESGRIRVLPFPTFVQELGMP